MTAMFLANRILEHSTARALRLVALALLPSVFAACGGGGGGGGTAPPPPPPPPPASWQQGLFMPASTFEARCMAPRAGNNPATGGAYPDVRGSTLDENNFLRSFSNDTYLWYDEIIDQNPALFNDPIVYFDELVTNARTPSGNFKDNFHFTIDSEEWFQLSQSGVSVGYGATFVLLSATPPRDVRVAYTDPGTPAASANLTRGAALLSIDGVDINTNTQAGIDTLNAGLFPSSRNESHTFTVRDLGAQNSRSITLVADVFASTPVQNVSVLMSSTGARVGYMLFNDHIATAEAGLIDAVNTLNAGQGIDELVLDIRYNGGGFLAIAAQLAYMIAGPTPTAGQPFETIQFNDKHPVTDPITGQPLRPTPFFTTTLGFDNLPQGQPLPNLGLSRVFVLTGPGTCSASEAVMNGLRGVDVEVIQIGSQTCGKPYGFYPTDNCGTTYFTIQFKGVNAKNFGEYSDGFTPANAGVQATTVPGCSVADDFTAALGDPTEARLKAALDYAAGQGCPAPSGFAQPGLSKAAAGATPADGIVLKSVWHTNRIMDLPNR
jgi:C-terminal processing protease CtpA/Prc